MLGSPRPRAPAVGTLGFPAPTQRWRQVRDTIRSTIETRGYDGTRGVFVRTLDGRDLDAALLLLPRAEFVAYDDERMIRTVEAIRGALGDTGGLVRRYLSTDGLRGDEGAFLACSFWLVECLARQGRSGEARRIFDQISALANDLGLFSEEYDPEANIMLGNFPQGLTHYSHICAALALARDA